ncbi:DUF6650 family protein [Streptomyces sp. NPDC005122]
MGIRPTEISIFGVGVGWEFKKSDRQTAQQIMDFLSDKRVLTVNPNRPPEDAAACVASAMECRKRLSELLDEVPVKSVDLRKWLRGLREAFTSFVEVSEHRGFAGQDGKSRFRKALHDLQTAVETLAGFVSERYKLTGLTALDS